MAIGIMEVKLVGAKGLKRTEYGCLCAFLSGKIGPYVLLQYRNQHCKSTTAKEEGTSPVWDEKLEFRVDSPLAVDDQYKLVLEIMDHSIFCADDYLGKATIYVKELIELGVEKGKAELRPQKYRVVSTNKTYQGEIQVGITFTAKEETIEEEEYGGHQTLNQDVNISIRQRCFTSQWMETCGIDLGQIGISLDKFLNHFAAMAEFAKHERIPINPMLSAVYSFSISRP